VYLGIITRILKTIKRPQWKISNKTITVDLIKWGKTARTKNFSVLTFSVKKTIIIDVKKICTTNVMNDEHHGTTRNRD